ncbi:unnamed protein product [Arabidopsis halleri]
MSNPSNHSSQEEPQRRVVLALPAISNTSLQHGYGLGRRGRDDRSRSCGRVSDGNQNPSRSGSRSNGGRGRERERRQSRSHFEAQIHGFSGLSSGPGLRTRSPSHSNGGPEPPSTTINTEEHLTMQIEPPYTIINTQGRRGRNDHSRSCGGGRGCDGIQSPSRSGNRSNGGRGRGHGRGHGCRQSRSRSPSYSNGDREPPSTTINTENGNDANDNVVGVTNIESDCKIAETVPPKTDEEILGDVDDDLLSLMHELPSPSMFDIG